MQGVEIQLTPDVSAGVESCFPFLTVAKWVGMCVGTANLWGTINWDTLGVEPRLSLGVCTVARRTGATYARQVAKNTGF